MCTWETYKSKNTVKTAKKLIYFYKINQYSTQRNLDNNKISIMQVPYERVPYKYMMPYLRPKRTQYTDEREYEQAVVQYQTELDQRWSCFRPTEPRQVSEDAVGGGGVRMSIPRPRPVTVQVGGRRRLDLSSDTDDEDDDVVMDVGGRGRLEYRAEEVEVDDESYLTLDGGDELSDYEDESDYDEESPMHVYYDRTGVFEQESPMHVLTYRLKTVTAAELEEKMTDSCCFCLEELKRADAVTTDCEHSFCVTCYDGFRTCTRTTARQKRTCPCCRKYVVKLTTYHDV